MVKLGWHIAGQAGIGGYPGWAGGSVSRLGRRSVSRLGRRILHPARARFPSPARFPGWAGVAPARLGLRPAGPPPGLLLPGPGVDLGRHTAPVSRALPQARAPAGPLGRAPRLGLWLADPAGLPPGRHLCQRPAGPDQEDPAWPGFSSRPPFARCG
jgi:hypothetical protein